MSPRPSRRELLAAFLTAPVVEAACRRPASPAFDGELVGGDVEHGHLLRDPSRAPRFDESVPVEEVPVLIVGAGPSGLSAAWRLARDGVRDALVLELESVEGGTARAGRNHVSAYPWGAHYVPAPSRENTALVALLREMGVVEGEDPRGNIQVGEQYLVRDLDERVYRDGVWHENLYPRDGASAEDLRQFESFQREVDRWVALHDGGGRRAFALPRALGAERFSEGPSNTTPEALDNETMAAWMDRHGYTSRRLRWLVEYACRDDYALSLSRTSAWAGLFYFASRVSAPGRPAEELIAFPEGNGALVAHLARSVAPGRLRTKQLVLDVRLTPTGVEADVLDLSNARGAPRPYRVRAAHAVLAVPRFVTLRVFAPFRTSPPEWSGAFTYSPWMVANLTLRSRPRVDPRGPGLAWDNVLYDSPSLGYVCATHQSLRDYGPTVFTYYYPLAGDDALAERRRLFSAGLREWTDVVLADLSVPHPDLAQRLERVDVYRWGHAMVRPTPGVLTGAALRSAARPYEGRVFFAHCDLSGLPLFEEAQFHGVLAAEELLRARGLAPTPLYPARATRG